MRKLKLMCLGLIFGLASCSSLMPSGQSDRSYDIASAYTVLSQVRLLAAEGVRSKVVTASEGRRFLELTDAARATIDKARDAHMEGKHDEARAGLNLAEKLLGEVREQVVAYQEAKAKREVK